MPLSDWVVFNASFRARESAAASTEKARDALERITDIASRLEGSRPSNLPSNFPLLTQ